MTALDLAQLPLWLGSLFWAVGRVSGLFLVAPVFSATVVSARIRIGVVVVLSLRDNPRNTGIGLLIMAAGVPVYAVWRRLFSRTLP